MRTRRMVALKLVLSDTLARKGASDALRRFEREARAAGSIDSRHVVSILDTGIEPSTNEPYIVMELLTGADLRALIRRRGPLAPELVLALAHQVCQGLHRAHEKGVVHRDIKAANIFLARRDGGELEVKILDFGIAKLRADPLASSDGNDLTRSGSVLGSPLYMSPEQATGSRAIDARSDIWSLGVVMYEALTGAPPHANKALGAVILAICSEPAPPLRERAPWVSEEVATLVHRAIALEPRQRYASAAEMQAAIAEQLPGGAMIRESVLEPLADSSDIHSETPELVADSSPLAQITVTAVTYGQEDGQGGRPSRARRVGRSLAVVGAVAAIAASVVLWRSQTSSSLADTGGATSKPVEAAASTAVVTETVTAMPAARPIERPEPSSLPKAKPAVGRREARAMDPRRAAPTPSVTPPSASQAPVPSPPPRADAPGIDRQFD